MQSCGTKSSVCSNDCVAGILTIFHVAHGDLAAPDAGVAAVIPIGADAILVGAVAGLFIVRSRLSDATNALLSNVL